VPAGFHHLVVTGPQMPAHDRRRVQRAAAPGTEVVRRVPDVLPLIRGAAAVVCMGGYNTVCEVMTTRTPALIAPRHERRAEQSIRAAALTRAGAVEALLPWQVDPAVIGDWFAAQAGRPVVRDDIALDGLDRVPQLAAELLGTGRRVVGIEEPSLEDERVAV
jgi:predicted glycosyltransferase